MDERASGGPASPFRDLPLDVRSERELGVLRATAAVVVGVVGLVVIALSPGMRGWLCGGVSVLFALGWWVSVRRARARLRAPDAWRLQLGPTHLELEEGPSKRSSVPWTEVRSVEVDEERLVVALEREGGLPTIRIEPRYGGLGVYALADAVLAAWTASRDAPPDDRG